MPTCSLSASPPLGLSPGLWAQCLATLSYHSFLVILSVIVPSSATHRSQTLSLSFFTSCLIPPSVSLTDTRPSEKTGRLPGKAVKGVTSSWGSGKLTQRKKYSRLYLSSYALQNLLQSGKKPEIHVPTLVLSQWPPFFMPLN